MDELRGPNIQIVLYIKEGIGFGFLKNPFIVSGSLNGYTLETDPSVPSHTPIFDAELVWEADKRRFRSLRIQNVPVKVEVFTLGTQGRKDRIGYLLLSLLGAQPCPSNKVVELKKSWHKLLGVKSEGKCCQPQLQLSLSIEDRTSIVTPRNELRLFHSNEVVQPQNHAALSATNTNLTYEEYKMESKKIPPSPDLQPKLMCDEGLIQIGCGNHLFILSFTIGTVENLVALLPDSASNKDVDCSVTYSIFTNEIKTDRVSVNVEGTSPFRGGARFNQRTSVRVRTSLALLSRYFDHSPRLLLAVQAAGDTVGVCSADLRKLIPIDVEDEFVSKFCNDDNGLKIHERCFISRCDGTLCDSRKPYLDIEMCLKYMGIHKNEAMPKNLTARSVSHLEGVRKKVDQIPEPTLNYRAGSCTNIDQQLCKVAYTNITATNTARYKNASGDSVLNTNELTELIKKMCESLEASHEKFLDAHAKKPQTCDMQVQCNHDLGSGLDGDKDDGDDPNNVCVEDVKKQKVPLAEQSDGVGCQNSSDCCCKRKQECVKNVLSPEERETLTKRCTEELEDWKEKQQALYAQQLKIKEEYHLELLAKEWEKRRSELESKLSRGIEQCRTLAQDLSQATEDFRLRGYRNMQREKKLLEAKKALETHYTAKYQELREASQKMEDDMNHQIKLKDMRIEEVELKNLQLQKQLDILKSNIENIEKDMEKRYSGLTKDQTASLIQELRCLEEKLESATQSKAFFKEQWGRAVRELHVEKMRTRRQLLVQLQSDRRQLHTDSGLETLNKDESTKDISIKRSQEELFVDYLATNPILEADSFICTPLQDINFGEDDKNAVNNHKNKRLNELMAQRDNLMHQEKPDENVLKQLNQEIRSLLLNCGS